MIRAALLDFDGTLVRHDILDLLADVNGKGDESRALNAEFHSGRRPGISALVDRVNLLRGVTLSQVHDVVSRDDHLMPGALELFQFLRERNVVTVIASGAILPVLTHYQQVLGADHIVGTAVAVEDSAIVGIDEDDLPFDGFKVTACMNLLTDLEIPIACAVAVGDSPAEKGLFVHAGLSIAINPVGGIERYADYVIRDDLAEVVTILRGAETGSDVVS